MHVISKFTILFFLLSLCHINHLISLFVVLMYFAAVSCCFWDFVWSRVPVFCSGCWWMEIYDLLMAILEKILIWECCEFPSCYMGNWLLLSVFCRISLLFWVMWLWYDISRLIRVCCKFSEFSVVLTSESFS